MFYQQEKREKAECHLSVSRMNGNHPEECQSSDGENAIQAMDFIDDHKWLDYRSKIRHEQSVHDHRFYMRHYR